MKLNNFIMPSLSDLRGNEGVDVNSLSRFLTNLLEVVQKVRTDCNDLIKEIENLKGG